jgi:hypothetical protein
MLHRHAIKDADWDRIKDLLPGQPGQHGKVAKNNRLFIDAILWIAKTGAPWRDLPERFGLWNSVWRRFDRWGPDATTYLSGGCHNLPITDICTTADLDRLNEQRYKVALIGTVFLREVAMSKRACRLNVAVRSSRPSDAACPNTRSPATSASLSRRSATGSSGHGDSDWTASTGTINRRSPAPRNAHRPTSRA